ncbi:MAG: hypothetical protein ACYSTF_07150 [Planctomycetota bacterium]|jgi:hypothetical protein
MGPSQDIEKIVKRLHFAAGAKMDDRLWSAILKAQGRLKKSTAKLEPNIWRKIMKSRVKKLGAAFAVIIIAAISITYFLGQLATPTYAITQTMEANRGMCYLHTKYFDGLHDDVGKECWLEFDESGLPKNVRINWSEWMGGGQIQIVLWNQDRTQIWQKKRNRRDRLLVFNDEIFTSRIHHMTESDDPRVTVEELYERQAKGEVGEVKVEIKEPGNRSEPIVVTATRLGGSKRRFVLYVDQATKLVTACEWYQLKDGEYEYEGVTKYYDYNVPIDAKMFSFDGLSGDVKRRIDTAVDDIGLAQGSLPDEEIAVKVVREYLDALIAKDYAKASQMCGGLSAELLQKGWEKLRITRIISIGEPTPPFKSSKLFPRMLSVPYKIKIEKDGKTTTWERQQNVRRVLGRRDRWIIQEGH